MLDVMKSRDDLLVIQDGFDYSIFVESFNCESGAGEVWCGIYCGKGVGKYFEKQQKL